jgi:hypothetical protein
LDRLIVGSQIGRIAERHENALAAQLNPRLRDAVTEFRVINAHARGAQGIAQITMRAAGLDVRRVVPTNAPIEPGSLRQREIQPTGDRQTIIELREIAKRRVGKGERIKAVNAREVRCRKRRSGSCVVTKIE